MAKSALKAAKAPGNPLNKMMEKMEWNMEQTDRDIVTLQSFIDKLGGEKRSTIQLAYPTIKELIALLDKKIASGEAKGFCQDLKSEVTKYFKFLLDDEHYNFNPLYIAATY
jgi:hypothetical protein